MVINRLRSWNWSLILWVIPITFFGVFYFFPLISIFTEGLFSGDQGFLQLIRDISDRPTVWRVVRFTLIQSIISTAITLIIGLPGAFIFARYQFPGRKLIRALMGIPFVLPTIVVAIAFQALLGPRGWANTLLVNIFNLERPPIEFIYTFTAIITAHVFYNTTIILRTLGDYWATVDPKITHAAQTLGANPFQVFRKITLPILTPVILSSTLLVLLFNFTSFGVILLLGGPRFATIEVEIYYQTVNLFNLPVAVILSIIQLLFTLVLTFVQNQLSRRYSSEVELRSRQHFRVPKSIFERWSTSLFLLGLSIFLLTPLVALFFRSITIYNVTSESSIFTLAYYKELFFGTGGNLYLITPLNTIGYSLLFASITVIIAIIVGIPTSILLSQRKNITVNKWVSPIFMLPLGTSAVTLGLGYIITFDQAPFNWRTSPYIVPFAHALIAIPFVIRILVPALSSIRQDIRDASSVLGANPFQQFLQIDLRLLSRSIIAAVIFAFMISLGEFGATSLIHRPEFPTIPIAIFRLISRPGALNYGQAMALANILMMTTMVGMVALEWIEPRSFK